MFARVLLKQEHRRLYIDDAMILGIVATLPMTLVMFHPSFEALPKVDIVRILGKLFTPIDFLAVPLGAICHFGLGAVFAASYAWLWHKGIGKVNLFWGFTFGAVHGVIASALMRYLLYMHPRPPQSWKLSNALVYVAAHVLFGTLVATFYQQDDQR
jgi:hypothetical protein